MKGTLHLHIVNGRQLQKNGHPLVAVVSLGPKQLRTQPQKAVNKAVTWDEQFALDLDGLQKLVATVTLVDVHKKENLGDVSLNFEKMAREGRSSDNFFPIMRHNGKSSGEIRVKLWYQPPGGLSKPPLPIAVQQQAAIVASVPVVVPVARPSISPAPDTQRPLPVTPMAMSAPTVSPPPTYAPVFATPVEEPPAYAPGMYAFGQGQTERPSSSLYPEPPRHSLGPSWPSSPSPMSSSAMAPTSHFPAPSPSPYIPPWPHGVPPPSAALGPYPPPLFQEPQPLASVRYQSYSPHSPY